MKYYQVQQPPGLSRYDTSGAENFFIPAISDNKNWEEIKDVVDEKF